MLLVDLDGFQQVNDTAGHLVGDRILVETAGILRGALAGVDDLYRIGGDEFAAVLRVGSAEEAVDVAERLRAAARAAARTTICVGITVAAPSPALTGEVMLAQADLALHEAKRSGRDSASLYPADMREAVVERARLMADLAAGIPRDELRCLYQPIVSLRSGRVIGLEALVRWAHPTRGLVTPHEFIPLAEEDGLITEVGRWVLDEVSRQAAEWQRQGWMPDDLRVGMNQSPAELHAERHGVDPDRLVIEVTESVFIAGHGAVEPLRRLRKAGVHVAIDDFGTGYSSLSYLQRLPIDVLKVDRSFVTDLDDRTSGAVLRAIVELPSALRLTLVAEGVEEEEQLAQLRALGCTRAQGYLWSHPVAPQEIPDLCRRLGTAHGSVRPTTWVGGAVG